MSRASLHFEPITTTTVPGTLVEISSLWPAILQFLQSHLTCSQYCTNLLLSVGCFRTDQVSILRSIGILKFVDNVSGCLFLFFLILFFGFGILVCVCLCFYFITAHLWCTMCCLTGEIKIIYCTLASKFEQLREFTKHKLTVARSCFRFTIVLFGAFVLFARRRGSWRW